ncbi:hypothetical protein Pcinc_037832 [Petrolisthes cinctipes]|nr:hypothetical protein Pcinc_037832 [Petrolisthes cinctipes]
MLIEVFWRVEETKVRSSRPPTDVSGLSRVQKTHPRGRLQNPNQVPSITVGWSTGVQIPMVTVKVTPN